MYSSTKSLISICHHISDPFTCFTLTSLPLSLVTTHLCYLLLKSFGPSVDQAENFFPLKFLHLYLPCHLRAWQPGSYPNGLPSCWWKQGPHTFPVVSFPQIELVMPPEASLPILPLKVPHRAENRRGEQLSLPPHVSCATQSVLPGVSSSGGPFPVAGHHSMHHHVRDWIPNQADEENVQKRGGKK